MSRLQQNWDWRAALNFMLGGAGAGLMVSAAFSPHPQYAAVLSMALVAAGLGAVWLEIGRKLRALHVFFNPATSWMTREAFLAVLFFGLGGASLALPAFGHAAALAALAFLYCQARILRAATGIPAWRVPQVVPLVVSTGLAEGCGLALFFGAGMPLLAVFALAVAWRALAWMRYRAAYNTPALAGAGTTVLRLGTVAAIASAAGAAWMPALAPLAGLAAIGAGWQLKLGLVTRAAFRQDVTLPRLPVRGAS